MSNHCIVHIGKTKDLRHKLGFFSHSPISAHTKRSVWTKNAEIFFIFDTVTKLVCKSILKVVVIVAVAVVAAANIIVTAGVVFVVDIAVVLVNAWLAAY